jgi:hypothetical protein
LSPAFRISGIVKNLSTSGEVFVRIASLIFSLQSSGLSTFSFLNMKVAGLQRACPSAALDKSYFGFENSFLIAAVYQFIHDIVNELFVNKLFKFLYVNLQDRCPADPMA